MARTPIRMAAVAAAVPVTAAVAAAALKVGRWSLHINRYRLRVTPVPARSYRDCHGTGGWWTNGPHPEMEACGCWADRRHLRILLLPLPPAADEPPF
ncbi:hypothetical protein ACIQFZ_38675 [Streptomyces sp. NPDC093064]|uniref:hypothetical protein n=1 Tax=unclassified Streptomyces TaxID=2593676 RepID=UPI00341F9FA9